MAKRNSKNPSSQVFWNDLRGDQALRRCSLPAKGLWTVHILPACAESQAHGVLIVGNSPSRQQDLGELLCNELGVSAEAAQALVDELVLKGVASVDDEGRLYNRRMVREEAERQRKSSAGRLGAAARWRGEDGRGDGRPDGTSDGRPDGTSDGRPYGSSGGSVRGGEDGGPDGTTHPATNVESASGPATNGGGDKRDRWQADGTPDGTGMASSIFSLHSSSVFPNGNTGDQGSPSPADVLFNAGLQWLMTASAHDEATCRTRIGSWLKVLGGDEAALLELMRDAQRARPKVRQPLTWLQAAINRRPKQTKSFMQAEADFIAERKRAEETGNAGAGTR